jgi:hypothetical protein
MVEKGSVNYELRCFWIYDVFGFTIYDLRLGPPAAAGLRAARALMRAPHSGADLGAQRPKS